MNIWTCKSWCAKWGPRILTIDQNQQRVDDSEQCLATFNRNKYEFFRRYITMDVTWLLHNTPESNRQSAEWTERDEPNPKRGKTQRSAGLSMRCAWYYIHRLPRKGPEHQQWVLHGVVEAMKSRKKRHHMKTKVLFHQDVSQIKQNDGKIAWIRLQIASPSIVFSRSGPQRLFLIADLKKMLAGRKSSTNQEVIVEN
jgi:hypothetical protein